MAPRKKAEAKPVAIDEPTQKLITRLRDQVQALAGDKHALEQENALLKTAKQRPSRKFETEKIRVNGFTISVAGKDCDENDVWIERVGDSVVILTGRAAEDRRNGHATAPVMALSATATRSTPDGSWTNLSTAAGASPVGLGPSPNMTDDEKAKLLLEGIESNIIASKGAGTGLQH